MKIPDRPFLKNLHSHQVDPARIIDLSPSAARSQIDLAWWVDDHLISDRIPGEPDRQWSSTWANIAKQAKGSDDFVCVQCSTNSGKETQGAILYSISGISLIDPGKKAVEGLLLATAPRNRSSVCLQPKYRGVGTSLLLYSVAHSYRLGLEGRIILASEPPQHTLDFYYKRGFTRFGVDIHGKIQMELLPDQAMKWLREAGVIQ